MKFTVVFDSPISVDYSFGLVFIPCPVWIRNKSEKILNLHPERMDLREGDFKKLIENQDYLKKCKKNLVLIVHKDGYGEKDDLKILINDIIESGFKPNIVFI